MRNRCFLIGYKDTQTHIILVCYETTRKRGRETCTSSNSYFGTVVAQDQPLGFLSENEAPFQDVIYDIDDVDDMFHIISRCPTFLDLFGGLLHVQYSSVWPHVST